MPPVQTRHKTIPKINNRVEVGECHHFRREKNAERKRNKQRCVTMFQCAIKHERRRLTDRLTERLTAGTFTTGEITARFNRTDARNALLLKCAFANDTYFPSSSYSWYSSVNLVQVVEAMLTDAKQTIWAQKSNLLLYVPGARWMSTNPLDKERKTRRSVSENPSAGVRWWLALFSRYQHVKLMRRTSYHPRCPIRKRIVPLNRFLWTMRPSSTGLSTTKSLKPHHKNLFLPACLRIIAKLYHTARIIIELNHCTASVHPDFSLLYTPHEEIL